MEALSEFLIEKMVREPICRHLTQAGGSRGAVLVISEVQLQGNKERVKPQQTASAQLEIAQ